MCVSECDKLVDLPPHHTLFHLHGQLCTSYLVIPSHHMVTRDNVYCFSVFLMVPHSTGVL